VPPHNLQAEESLLGAMLLSRDAIAAAVEITSADDFYKPAHGHIYDAITALFASGEPVDPVTVAEELNRAGLLEAIGGGATLVSIQASTPATTSAARYARIVEEHALLRRLIGVAGEIAEIGYDLPEDVTKAVDRAETMVFEVAQRRITDSTAPIGELLSANLDRLEQLYERGESITGLPSGYIDLDEILAGMQPSNLIVVGARPAMGKTSFALGMAAHAGLHAHKPVLVFSLEMSQLEVSQRILCAEARVDATKVRTGRLAQADWAQLSHAVGRLAEAPIYIDDNPNVNVMEIRAKSRRLKSKVGELGLVIIDYVQLMGGRSRAENRQVEVAEISRSLKILARELEAPVVALAQLNRSLEQRADKRPMLSDLRESGCMPATTMVMRADNGEEISLGELVLTQQQPVVWSVDDGQRLVPAKLLRTFPTGRRPVFRMRLASGRSVDATANHRFLTIDGWSRLDSLPVGANVAVPRRLPAPVRPGVGWFVDELVLLAHMLGAASMGPRFEYATTDPANIDVVVDLVRRLFGIETGARKEANTWKLWFPSPYPLIHGVHHPMRNWLEPHGLWRSRAWTKFVPSPIFGLDDARVALFLRHLWATNGSITTGRNSRGPTVSTRYATTSIRLALDVQRLLLRLGVRSTIGRARTKRAGPRRGGIGCDREAFSVRVHGAANQARLLRQVGCPGAGGARIPEALAILAAIEEGPDAGELADPATSDLEWDRVVEVTAVGEQPTFDVTIDGTHNFMADGVVAHNSLEQDADVVLFLYRDDVYNPDSPDRGIAEVLVSKHRSGPTGRVRLAWLEHYTKFANMAKGL